MKKLIQYIQFLALAAFACVDSPLCVADVRKTGMTDHHFSSFRNGSFGPVSTQDVWAVSFSKVPGETEIVVYLEKESLNGIYPIQEANPESVDLEAFQAAMMEKLGDRPAKDLLVLFKKQEDDEYTVMKLFEHKPDPRGIRIELNAHASRSNWARGNFRHFMESDLPQLYDEAIAYVEERWAKLTPEAFLLLGKPEKEKKAELLDVTALGFTPKQSTANVLRFGEMLGMARKASITNPAIMFEAIPKRVQ